MEEHSYKKVTDLTTNIIEMIYQRRANEIKQFFHPDIMWIEAKEGQYLFGYSEVMQYLEKVSLSLCEITEQDYKILMKKADVCVVVGKYSGTMDGKEKGIWKGVQCVTFIWKKEKEMWQVLHVHMSHHLKDQNSEENFHHIREKAVDQLGQKPLEQRVHKQNKLVVQDKHKNHFIVDMDQIIYLEAFGEKCQIYCLEREIMVFQPLSVLEKRLGDSFIRIHRSYIVNVKYVTDIYRYEVILSHKILLPIPQKRYKEVKEEVLRKLEER